MKTLEVWGLVQAAIMTAVILMNGKGWRVGWLVGALAQATMVVFGAVLLAGYTFWFLLVPLAGFVYNWLAHPHRVDRLRAKTIKEYKEDIETRKAVKCP